MKTSIVISGLVLALCSIHVFASKIAFEQADNKIFLAWSDCDDVYESCKSSCQSLAEQCANSRNDRQEEACLSKVKLCLNKCERYIQRCSK